MADAKCSCGPQVPCAVIDVACPIHGDAKLSESIDKIAEGFMNRRRPIDPVEQARRAILRSAKRRQT